MKACLTVTGSTMDLAFVDSSLKQNIFDMVVAVGGGPECLKPFGLFPDAAVGDFDAVSLNVLAEYREME